MAEGAHMVIFVEEKSVDKYMVVVRCVTMGKKFALYSYEPSMEFVWCPYCGRKLKLKPWFTVEEDGGGGGV